MTSTHSPLVLAPLLALAGVVGTPTDAHADKQAKASQASDDDRVDWGVGVQARRIRVSQRTLRLFLDDSPGPVEQDGGALVFTRRGKSLELVIGLGYDPLDGIDGYYLEQNGDPTMSDTVSYIEFKEPMWFTAEVTIVGHAQLHKVLGLRYGFGLGIGYVHGAVHKTDSICTGTDLQRPGVCGPDPAGMNVDEPVELWPVMPVVNALIGLELRPIRSVALYVDAGLHTAPYVGVGATVYLWED